MLTITDDELLHMWLATEMDDIYSFPEYKRIMTIQQTKENDDSDTKNK